MVPLNQTSAVIGTDYVARLEVFVRDLLDPEIYGHAVNGEIRNRARSLLGIEPVAAEGQSKCA